MRALCFVSGPLALVMLVASTASVGCDADVDGGSGDGVPDAGSQASSICVVAAGEGVTTIVATANGVVMGAGDDSGFVLRRFEGEGCALAPTDDAPIAASGLLDADDAGNLYVRPAASADPTIVSTNPEDAVPFGTVVKVDREGHVSNLVTAGRGIWDFGVSPTGETLWMTACGPTGIFSPDAIGLTDAMTPPDTLWAQRPSVLTDDATFWSVGYRTCEPGTPMSEACGYALTRTSSEVSEEVGTTLVDFGSGIEEGDLARCGSRVCGAFASGIVVWTADGAVRATLDADDLGALPTEQIGRVTGNDAGVYVLLLGDEGSRVVFVVAPA